jgi:hypothetical protein
VKVEREPANLKVTMSDNVYGDDNSILVCGDFALGTDYTVTVAGETAAIESFTLGRPASRKVSGDSFLHAFSLRTAEALPGRRCGCSMKNGR